MRLNTEVKRMVTAFTIFSLVGYYGQNTFALVPYDSTKIRIEQELIYKINRQRVLYGLEPLIKNPKLMKSARFKSLHMKEHEYYSHTSPIYGNFYEIPRLFGHTGTVGEVLHGISHGDLWDIVDGWLGSSYHRDLLLHPDAVSLGVGVATVDVPFVVRLEDGEFLISGLTTVHFGF